MDKETIDKAIEDELKRAKEKWPIYYSDIIHSASLITEEAGEPIRAALNYVYDNGSIDDVIKETVQTAAMCRRLLENVEKLKAFKRFIEE